MCNIRISFYLSVIVHLFCNVHDKQTNKQKNKKQSPCNIPSTLKWVEIELFNRILTWLNHLSMVFPNNDVGVLIYIHYKNQTDFRFLLFPSNFKWNKLYGFFLDTTLNAICLSSIFWFVCVVSITKHTF